MTVWGDLKRGDIILCPSDGQREKVHRIIWAKAGRVAVRTSRHDHNNKPSDGLVTKEAR